MFVQPDEKAYTLNDARAMFEHRARWLYYLAENPADERATAPLHKAIRKCGLYHAAAKFGKFRERSKFNELFTAEPVRSVFEMEIVRRPTRSSRSTSVLPARRGLEEGRGLR